jgi:hypothetical protein
MEKWTVMINRGVIYKLEIEAATEDEAKTKAKAIVDPNLRKIDMKNIMSFSKVDICNAAQIHEPIPPVTDPIIEEI